MDVASKHMILEAQGAAKTAELEARAALILHQKDEEVLVARAKVCAPQQLGYTRCLLPLSFRQHALSVCRHAYGCLVLSFGA